MKSLFLDSVFLIALACPRDQHHRAATRLADQLQGGPAKRLITTRAVQLEVINALSATRYREAACGFLDYFAADPRLEVVELSRELLQDGEQLFRERPDKEWSLTDCLSFVVMDQYDVRDALTHDEHFEQAGFRAMLREAA
jgi:predicted nucleic acid-binding protein